MGTADGGGTQSPTSTPDESADTSTTSSSLDATSSSSGDSVGSDTENSESSTGSVGALCDIDLSNTTCRDPSPYRGPGSCNPYAPDCPEGQKCSAWSEDGGTRCIPLSAQTVGEDEVCWTYSVANGDYLDNCDEGLFCDSRLIDPEDAGSGLCVAQCTCSPADRVCGDGAWCFGNPTYPGIALCFSVDGCNPLKADCDEARACYPILRVNDYAFHCRAPGVLPPGSPCPEGVNCDENSICSNNVCRRVCDLEDPAACEAGENCVTYVPPGEQALEPFDACTARVGVCE